MVSKSTSILLAVAVVAVSAVAIIGLGYAYTASTENSGNTTGTTYITLTPQANDGGWAVSYTGAFVNPVKYDTVSISNGAGGSTVTYTLNTEQIDTFVTISATPYEGIELGEAKIVVNSVGSTADYIFSVQKTAGTMNGDFFIAYKIGDAGSYVYKSFDPASVNYYSTGDSASAVTIKPSANVDGATTAIYVKMFALVDDEDPLESTTLNDVKPLSDVTFQFKAEVPEPAH